MPNVRLDNLIKPYDDKSLVYDKYNHRYIIATTNPTIDMSIYGDNAMKLQRTLDKISRKVYAYLKLHCNTNNFDLVELVLSCTEEGRKVMRESMEAQLIADMESGMTDITDESAIDFNRGTNIDRKFIRENRLCVDAEDILIAFSKPINLCYLGDYGVRLSNNRYDLWGY